MSNADNTKLALTNTGREKRKVKPIDRFGSSPTTSNQGSSSRSATTTVAAEPTNNNKSKLRTYNLDTCVRDCDNWRAENGTNYSNVIRGEFGNSATKLLTPAMCHSKGIKLPGLPDDFSVELYKHGEEYYVRVTNAWGFSRFQGYKDFVTLVDTKGRGGNKTNKTGVTQMLHSLKHIGFTLTELDADIVTETNDQIKSQMLNDPNRVIYLRYIGDGPKPSPKLTRDEAYNQFVYTDNNGKKTYYTRVKDYEDAIRKSEPPKVCIRISTPRKRILASTNSKREAAKYLDSNDASVSRALKKEGEKKVSGTDYIVSPNKTKARHALGPTPLGKELLNCDHLDEKKKGGEKNGSKKKEDEDYVVERKRGGEDMDENLDPSDDSRPRRKCRGKY